jgi:hypothetical protein
MFNLPKLWVWLLSLDEERQRLETGIAVENFNRYFEHTNDEFWLYCREQTINVIVHMFRDETTR